MRKIITIAFVLLLSGCSQYLNQPMRTTQPRLGSESEQHKMLESLPDADEPIIVAVYKFRDQTGQYKDAELGTSWSTAVTQGATSILLRALEESKWFVPIEREGLNNLLNERKIIRSSRSGYSKNGNQEQQPLIPPLLFAGVILEGGVISFDSNMMTGGAGARYFGVGVSGQYRVDRITIYLRATSTSNGRILKTVYTSKTILSQKVDVGIFKFVDFKRLLEIETGFTYNEPGEMVVREAIEKAVTSLIIEGAIDGLWKFKNPEDINSKVVKSYLKEKSENKSIDVVGSKFEERRGHFSVGIKGAGWYYLGDLSGSQILPAIGIHAEMFSTRPVSLNVGLGYGTIGTARNYKGDMLLGEVAGNYKWFPKLKSTPYIRFGFGAMAETNNNLNDSTKAFSRVSPYILGELGYEILLNKKLGLSFGATYRYTIDDSIDRIENGKYNDALWEGKLGLNYYFGK